MSFNRVTIIQNYHKFTAALKSPDPVVVLNQAAFVMRFNMDSCEDLDIGIQGVSWHQLVNGLVPDFEEADITHHKEEDPPWLSWSKLPGVRIFKLPDNTPTGYSYAQVVSDEVQSGHAIKHSFLDV